MSITDHALNQLADDLQAITDRVRGAISGEVPSVIIGVVSDGRPNLRIRTDPTTEFENVLGEHSAKAVIKIVDIIEVEGADDTWAKFEYEGGYAYSAIEYNGQTYIDIQGVAPPELPVWLPDPNRLAQLFYTRDGGFRKVKVYRDSQGKVLDHDAYESAIFIGDRIEGNYLHIVTENTKESFGWIDYTENGMIDHSQIPEEVLNSLCPPAPEFPLEIARTVTAPSELDKTYWHIELDENKPYNFPVPNTIPLWKDKGETPGFSQVPDKWQWFIFDAIKMSFPGQSILFYVSVYAYFIRDNGFYTDGHDKDDKRDVILGRNPNAENYWIKWSLTTRGNVLQAYHKNGADIYLDGFDISQDPPSIFDTFHNDTLWHYETQVYPEVLANGFNKVTHSPPKVAGDKIGIKAIPIFRTGFAVDKNEIGAVEVQAGQVCPVVNLERDQE
mgnify:FL=1